MPTTRWPIGSCEICHAWGQLWFSSVCRSCLDWRTDHRDRQRCRRCQHPSLVGGDRLCRPCLIAIRQEDHEWFVNPGLGARGTQLRLVFASVPGNRAISLHLNGSAPARGRIPPWLARILPAPRYDDPRVLPPTGPGQLVLFHLHRRLTQADAARVRDRELPFADAAANLARQHTERAGLSRSSRDMLIASLRLMLAVRLADGVDLVREDVADGLECLPDATRAILAELNLLAPRLRSRRSKQRTWAAQSCPICNAWGRWGSCRGCQTWVRLLPRGRCPRCRRDQQPLREGLCRGCTIHLATTPPPDRDDGSTQLRLGEPFGTSLRTPTGKLGYDWTRPKPPREPGTVSAHQVDPYQGELFPVLRDWTAVDDLPALTPEAAVLLLEFQEHARRLRWAESSRGTVYRTLRTLIAWLGITAPLKESDVLAIAKARYGAGRRVLRFLEDRGLLHRDLASPEPNSASLKQKLDQLPEPIRGELQRWVDALRGLGRRRRPALALRTIDLYLWNVLPILAEWSTRADSLREVDADDITGAAAKFTGERALHVLTALRSIFRTLKRERVIFHDPTRGITLHVVRYLPQALPADRVAGLLDRAGTPLGRLLVALVAIHALGTTEIIAIQLADLDLARKRLTTTRTGRRHTIYLDDTTLSCINEWLRFRRQRWQREDNPHLIVSRITAPDTSGPPVTPAVIMDFFRPLGVTAVQLRVDRLYDEARHTADPVHLVRVFGVSTDTAMRYLVAAHPGLF